MGDVMKVTRSRRTDADRLAEAQARVEKRESALAQAKADLAAVVAEIKSKRDALDALMK